MIAAAAVSASEVGGGGGGGLRGRSGLIISYFS